MEGATQSSGVDKHRHSEEDEDDEEELDEHSEERSDPWPQQTGDSEESSGRHQEDQDEEEEAAKRVRGANSTDAAASSASTLAPSSRGAKDPAASSTRRRPNRRTRDDADEDDDAAALAEVTGDYAASASAGSAGAALPVPVPVEVRLLAEDDKQYERAGIRRLAAAVVPPGARDLDFYHGHRADYAPRLGADIIDYYRLLETNIVIDRDYFTSVQSDVTPSMRAVLVDWLHSLHVTWGLRPETLFLAVQLCDRFLSVRAAPRSRLQLVAIAAMMAACKLEEQHPPALADFAASCRHAYSEEQIRQAEAKLCRALQWRLRGVSARNFLARFLDAGCARCGDMQANLTKMLCEIALLEARFIGYRPSLVCAAAVHAARRQLGMGTELPGARPSAAVWNATLERFTGYKEADVLHVSSELLWAFRDAQQSKLRSVISKYARTTYASVSHVVRPISKTSSASSAELLAEFPADEPSHSCHTSLRKRRI